MENIFAAMMLEHEQDSLFFRKSGEAYVGKQADETKTEQLVNPFSEWNVVTIGELSLSLGHCTPKIKKRSVVRKYEWFAEIAQRKNLGLVEAEIIALRLWTGPMFQRYAFLLRAVMDKISGPPTAAITPFCYTTTIHALNSGIVKLSKTQRARCIVYRGLHLDQPKCGYAPFTQGMEICPMAFTTDLSLAERYGRGDGGVLLESDQASAAESGEPGGGACIGWLSQFPHEYEVLFPALSCLQCIGEQTSTSGRSIWAVSITACGESKTLEEFDDRCEKVRNGANFLSNLKSIRMSAFLNVL